MHQIFSPFAISFIWLAPFFVLAYQAGKIYYQRWLEDDLNLSLKLNLVNVTFITIIAIRNLTLVAYYQRGKIDILNNLWPFILLFSLVILAAVAGVFREKSKYYSHKHETKKPAMIIAVSIVAATLFMGYAGVLGEQVGLISDSINNSFFKANVGTESKKKPENIDRLLKKYPLLANNYIPEIDSFITYVVKHPSSNRTVIWYRPIRPDISEKTRGVTVLITKVNNVQQAKQLIKLRKNNHPKDSSLVVINGREMYKGYSKERTNENSSSNKDYKTCLIAWSQNSFTFEIYSTMNDFKDVDKNLLLDQAKKVAAAVYEQARGKL